MVRDFAACMIVPPDPGKLQRLPSEPVAQRLDFPDSSVLACLLICMEYAQWKGFESLCLTEEST